MEKIGQTGPESVRSSATASNIARIFQRTGRIGEAVATARLAYLYGPENEKVEHLALFSALLEANGDIEMAAEARSELAELRKNVGVQGE